MGVNRRTGTRWRFGRTITLPNGRTLQYPAVINTQLQEISPRCLSEDERLTIADWLGRAWCACRRGQSGRDPSTISRELRRNRDPASGKYRPFTAQQLAVAHRARSRVGKLVRDAELREFVRARLRKRWSPTGLPGAPQGVPHQPDRHVVHETIYQALYRPNLRGLPDLSRMLRTRRRTRGLVDMIMLDQRPAEAVDRAVPGYWEGDLIVGASTDPRSASGGTDHPLRTPAAPARRSPRRRSRPGRAHRRHVVRTGTPAPITYLGSGQGAGPARRHRPCSSARRPVRGSVPATKSPTGCSGSTSPKAPTSRCTIRSSPPTSASNSTAVSARPSTGKPQRAASLSSSRQPNDHQRCDDDRNPLFYRADEVGTEPGHRPAPLLYRSSSSGGNRSCGTGRRPTWCPPVAVA